MNTRNTLAVIAASAIFSPSSFAADIDKAQLIKDCEHEAVAVGFSGTDVDDYIIECVQEFEETEIVNTKLPPEK